MANSSISSYYVSSNISDMLLNEYGIEDINEAKSWGNNFINNLSVTRMIDRVKERLLKNEPSTNDMLESDADGFIRFNYAWRVAHTLHWTDYADGNLVKFMKKVFVKLRMLKAWKHTEVNRIEPVMLALSNAGLLDYFSDKYTCWEANIDNLVEMIRRGMTPKQIVRLMGLVKPVLDGTVKRNIGNNGSFYTNGFHAGDWMHRMIHGIRPGHLKHFDRFMRVFKHTHKINERITSRFFTGERAIILDGLSESELRMTVTDSRNWLKYNRKFQLNVIVKDIVDWEPVRKNHLFEQAWTSSVGRTPMNKLIADLPIPVVKGFNKAVFREFLKDYKYYENLGQIAATSEHSVLALAKLHVWFGKDWKNVLKVSDPSIIKIHELGINLPETVNNDARTFLKRYVHKWADAVRIACSWEIFKENGIDPLGKEGMSNCVKFLASMLYEGVRDTDFARECSKWGYSQDQFSKYQKMWMERYIEYSSIPKISLSEGDWKFYLLDRNDARGPFLGEYTGCCQHPNGVGAACAFHGASSTHGGFVILEYQGDIKFQSWVWRKDNVLVFDNIEGNCNQALYTDAKRIYLEGVRMFMSKLCIDKLYIGTSHSCIQYDDIVIPKERGFSAPCYSDSHRVWEVTP